MGGGPEPLLEDQSLSFVFFGQMQEGDPVCPIPGRS